MTVADIVLGKSKMDLRIFGKKCEEFGIGVSDNVSDMHRIGNTNVRYHFDQERQVIICTLGLVEDNVRVKIDIPVTRFIVLSQHTMERVARDFELCQNAYISSIKRLQESLT